MQVKETLCMALWLETAEEVRSAAYFMKYFYDDDDEAIDDPDQMVLQAEEIMIGFDEMGQWYGFTADESWLKELKNTVSALSSRIPVQFFLTDNMKLEIESILPEMYEDDFRYNRIKEAADRLSSASTSAIMAEVEETGLNELLPEVSSDKHNEILKSLTRSEGINLLMQHIIGEEDIRYPYQLFHQ